MNDEEANVVQLPAAVLEVKNKAWILVSYLGALPFMYV